ncbi:MAG: DNRLRE domain-containing protein [Byssovorax sp.]
MCARFARGARGNAFDSLLNQEPGTGSKNYGALPLLATGVIQGTARMSIYRWDLSSIPHGSTLIQATLTLGLSSAGAGTLRVHRVLAPWSEGTITWNSAAGIFDPAPLFDIENGYPTVGKVVVDVAPLVDAWLSGLIPNHGILLDQVTAPPTYVKSSEWPVAGLRPALDICYQEPSCAAPDGVKNGDETDVDCGGRCPTCPANASCQVDADCLSGICQDHLVCVAPGEGGLVLFSRLDSAADLLHPDVGPAGAFATGSFVPGVLGSALEVDMGEPGALVGQSGDVLPGQVIPTRRGTIEMWARLTGYTGVVPVGSAPALFGYRMDVAAPELSYSIMFNGNNGNSAGGLTAWAGNTSVGTGCFTGSYTYEGLLGSAATWHHVALSWDVNGIPGVGGKIQIYLDGAPHGTPNLCGQVHDPSMLISVPGAPLWLIGTSYLAPGRRVAIDNLKIWSHAKTDFSDALSEGSP